MDASEYILPDSDTRCTTKRMWRGLSEEEIRIAVLNEIYARATEEYSSQKI